MTAGQGARGLVFLAVLVLLGAGVSIGVGMRQPFAFLAVLLGVGLFIWLVRSEPKAIYAEYMRIDVSGIKYVQTPEGSSRVSQYGWNEIEDVTISTDPRGIWVFTNRTGMKGVGIFLLTHGHGDAQAAFTRASERLHSRPL